jgi:hypothetical protein
MNGVASISRGGFVMLLTTIAFATFGWNMWDWLFGGRRG